MESGPEAPTKPRGRGRPRREDINASALTATIDLLVAGGLRAVTIERVAAAIHATREALYRRWPNAQALLEEALGEVMLQAAGRTHGGPPYSSDNRELEDAVRQLISRLTEVFSAPRYSACYLAILAGARQTPEFERFLEAHNAGVLTGIADALAANPAFAGCRYDVVAKLVFSAAVHPTLTSPHKLDREEIALMAKIIAKGLRSDA